MEYRAGQPQEEGGIDGCGLSSLARTFARCTRTSGYEFNHRAGPDTDARVSKPGSGAAHKETSGSEHRRLRIPPRSAIGRSQGGGSGASMTVIQEGRVCACAVPGPAACCQSSDKFHISGMSDMTDKQTIRTFVHRSAAQPTSLRRKK